MTRRWLPQATRDAVVDTIRTWNDKTGVPVSRMLGWLNLPASKYYQWIERYCQANRHNATLPKTHWLTDAERRAILEYYREHPGEGYRRLAYLMLDANVVAASPASVYRVLVRAGLLRRWNRTTKKGTGFVQPLKPHENWHIDVSYLNIAWTFYYLCSVLDGCSRFLVHWEIRTSMTELDVETILHRAYERHPGVTPRIISDNGPQFIAKDFKEYIRTTGMTHVRTSPYYPQSNGKIERWHKTLKGECVRPLTPTSLDDARRIVGQFVEHYNNTRLHSAIGYVTPADRLAGRHETIRADRQRKLAEAKVKRREEWKAENSRLPEATAALG